MNIGISPSSSDYLVFSEKFIEAKETMKSEIIDFFQKYIREVDGEEFWNTA